ncbi:MAG TPA: hypothetical protein VNS79_07635 [Sphingobium sp.]|nr:hypothetical protein [Sphingobium sp.]
MTATRPVLLATAMLSAVLLAPAAMAVPKGAPPTSLGDLARPDWADGAPVIVEPDAARRRIVACGVDGARVTVRDDARLRETVLVVASGAVLSDEQLTCMAGASLETGYQIIVGADLAARYDATYERLEKARAGQ